MFDRTLDFLEKNHLPVFVSFVVVVLGGSVWLINPFSIDINKLTEAKAANPSSISSSVSVNSINTGFDAISSRTSISSINMIMGSMSSSSSVSSSSVSSINSTSSSSITSISSSSISSVNPAAVPAVNPMINPMINPMTGQVNQTKLPITPPITPPINAQANNPQTNLQNDLVNKDVSQTDQTITQSSQAVQNTNTPATQVTTSSARPEFQLKNNNLTSTTPASSSCPAGKLSIYTSNVGNMVVRKEEDFAQSALAQIKDFLNGNVLIKQVGTTANFWQNPIQSSFVSSCGSLTSNVIKNINVLATGADQTRAFISLNSSNGQVLGDPTIEIYGHRSKNYFVLTKSGLVTQAQKEAAATKCKIGQINNQMNDTCYEQEMLQLVNDSVIQTNVLALINEFALE